MTTYWMRSPRCEIPDETTVDRVDRVVGHVLHEGDGFGPHGGDAGAAHDDIGCGAPRDHREALAGELVAVPLHGAGEKVLLTDEAGDERRRRLVVDRVGIGRLLDVTVEHHRRCGPTSTVPLPGRA